MQRCRKAASTLYKIYSGFTYRHSTNTLENIDISTARGFKLGLLHIQQTGTNKTRMQQCGVAAAHGGKHTKQNLQWALPSMPTASYTVRCSAAQSSLLAAYNVTPDNRYWCCPWPSWCIYKYDPALIYVHESGILC